MRMADFEKKKHPTARPITINGKTTNTMSACSRLGLLVLYTECLRRYGTRVNSDEERQAAFTDIYFK